MRTTLTLDDDLAARLRDRSRLTGATFKEVVNEALRAGLRSGQKPTDPLPPFRVTPIAGGFRTGVDMRRLNQLNDELESQGFFDNLAPPATR